MIPPSAILVIYGLIVEESIGKLLLAGFLPGLFSALVYGAIIVAWSSIRPGDRARGRRLHLGRAVPRRCRGSSRS